MYNPSNPLRVIKFRYVSLCKLALLRFLDSPRHISVHGEERLQLYAAFRASNMSNISSRDAMRSPLANKSQEKQNPWEAHYY